MNDLIKIEKVQPRGDLWLRTSFSDGAVKDVDVANVLARGGEFTAIREHRELFERVRVNPRLRRSSGLGG